MNCRVCNNFFCSVNEFIKHVKSHNDFENLSCPKDGCCRKYSTFESLRFHLKTHFPDKNKLAHIPENVFPVLYVISSNDNVTGAIDNVCSSLVLENKHKTGNTSLVDIGGKVEATTSTTDLTTKIKIDILKYVLQIYNEDSFARQKSISILRGWFTTVEKHIETVLQLIEPDKDKLQYSREIIAILNYLSHPNSLQSEYKIFRELQSVGFLLYPKCHIFSVEDQETIFENGVNIKKKNFAAM